MAERVVQLIEREAAAFDDEPHPALLTRRDEAALERLEPGENHQQDRGRADRADVHASARREADARYRPQARGRRESAYHLAAQQDRSRAEKTDAGDDLCGHPRRIENDARPALHVREAERGHEHHERRADRDEHVRAQAGGPVHPFALEADHAAEQRGEQQAAQQFDVVDHDRSPPFVVFLVASMRRARRRAAAAAPVARGGPGMRDARRTGSRKGAAAGGPA